MEKALEKNENAVPKINIFLCYAHEDKAFLDELMQHLASLKRQGLITSWHDGDILAGTVWEREIRDHLNSAQLILLLISPSFMSSDYCYGTEMSHALERQSRRECRVIPVIIRSVYWQGEPLGKLQALPTGGKPVASWPNRDEAFFDVVEGIRHIIDKIKTQSSIPPPSYQELENNGEDLRNTDLVEQKTLQGVPLTKQEVQQELLNPAFHEDFSQVLIDPSLRSVKNEIPLFRTYKPKNKSPRLKLLLVSVAILLALAVTLFLSLPLPTCAFAFCRPSQQYIKQTSSQNEDEVHDQNLSMKFVDVVSPSFVLLDSNTSPRSISGVSLAKNTPTYDKIIVEVQNLRNEGVDILIDYIALKLLSIPELPQPLHVWTPGVATTYIAYSYPVKYDGQKPGQLIYAEPVQNVILKSGEANQLSIQIESSVIAYLQFQVQLSYQIADENSEPPLTLTHIFSVVFYETSNQ